MKKSLFVLLCLSCASLTPTPSDLLASLLARIVDDWAAGTLNDGVDELEDHIARIWLSMRPHHLSQDEEQRILNQARAAAQALRTQKLTQKHTQKHTQKLTPKHHYDPQ